MFFSEQIKGMVQILVFDTGYSDLQNKLKQAHKASLLSYSYIVTVSISKVHLKE